MRSLLGGGLSRLQDRIGLWTSVERFEALDFSRVLSTKFMKEDLVRAGISQAQLDVDTIDLGPPGRSPFSSILYDTSDCGFFSVLRVYLHVDLAPKVDASAPAISFPALPAPPTSSFASTTPTPLDVIAESSAHISFGEPPQIPPPSVNEAMVISLQD